MPTNTKDGRRIGEQGRSLQLTCDVTLRPIVQGMSCISIAHGRYDTGDTPLPRLDTRDRDRFQKLMQHRELTVSDCERGLLLAILVELDCYFQRTRRVFPKDLVAAIVREFVEARCGSKMFLSSMLT